MGVKSFLDSLFSSTTNLSNNEKSSISASRYGSYDAIPVLIPNEAENLSPASVGSSSDAAAAAGAIPVTILHKRRVTALHIGVVAFFAVASGPIGIEDAIGAAGPVYTLITLVVVSLAWALPQGYMSIELSTMFPENGGYIMWVRSAFGDFVGFFNAYCNMWCNFFDVAMYPILFVQYIQALVPLTDFQRFFLILGLVVLVHSMKPTSYQDVGSATVLFTIAVLAPYIIEPLVSFNDFNPSNLTETFAFKDIDWNLFLNTILWNFSGWDALGCVAGEVKNPKRSYPVGISFGVLLVFLNYVIPVCVAGMLDNNWDNYEEGYFINIAANVYPWLGRWVLVAACVSVIGSLNVVFSTTSRALWRAGKYGILPQFVSYEWKKFGSPIVALSIQAFTTTVIAYFGNFETIVVLDNFLNCITLIFELLAFIWLKWKFPNMERPVEIPGGLTGAILVSIPKAALLILTIAVANSMTWIVCSGLMVLSALMYPFWIRGKLTRISSDWHPVYTPKLSNSSDLNNES
jgi:amino acid transporter